ncbi:hypothetical protein glysoja_045178 [Glycine soja]|uniref:Uncharacterized protein n=1 Tax=Glycine soja TaxID=3848 RepID=A0A0B2P137_GLYSO|nr:hypothetical protein glysoja_045178 [Glycine soja]
MAPLVGTSLLLACDQKRKNCGEERHRCADGLVEGDREIVVGEDEPEDRIINPFKKEVLKAGVLQECKRRRFSENKDDKIKRKARKASRRNQKRGKNQVKASCNVGSWTTEMDSQPSGSAADVVDVNESGSSKLGGSEPEGVVLCLQDRLKWLDQQVIRKVV